MARLTTEIGFRSGVLDALGASAFRMENGMISWSDDLGLPDSVEAYLDALGSEAPSRDAAIRAQDHYQLSYHMGPRLFEETGRRFPDGSLAGIVRCVEDRAASELPPLSREEIVDALNSRRVHIAYQPIVDARTRRTQHYECLMRMQTEAGDILPAFQVIESAEALGLVALLDRRALELAARRLIGTHRIHLALNVSAQTVADPHAADDYLDALKMLGPAARRLTLELTETVAVNDPTHAARFASQARAMGCKFAIDDFGSGYTTFRNLMAIEADSIKIDGDFVDGLLTSRQAQTFVRMMVDLAQTFAVETVAERVETEDVANMLTEFGVDRLQGYLFGKPELEIEELAA